MPAHKKVKLPPKVCEYEPCGKTFEQHDKEAPNRYRTRRFCGVECRAASTRIDPNTVRICKACGEGFKCRENEEMWRFTQRDSCGKSKCAAALRKGKRYGDMSYQSPRRNKPPTKRRPKITVVPKEKRMEQQGPPVPIIPPSVPTYAYVPRMDGERAQFLTQADRTARRSRFGSSFGKAS